MVHHFVIVRVTMNTPWLPLRYGADERTRTFTLSYLLLRQACLPFHHIGMYGDANGIRTRVTAVKGRCLRPLDHGAISDLQLLYT